MPPRRPTPRPTFDVPTRIPATDHTRHMWGDANAGFVIDRVYVSSEHLHVLDFSLPPGGRFGHSPENPTIFAADELLVVLEGTLMLSDPSTGETQRMETGDAVFFERDTWHHGRAGGSTGVRVLEFFSPTPTTGASSAYAKQQPYLDHIETVDARIFERWPTNTASLRAAHRLIPIRDHDLAWAQRGELEFAFYAATEHVTVTRSSLRPGASSAEEVHPGEEFVLVLEGDLMVMTPDAAVANCLLAGPGDAVVLPPGTRHSYLACGDGAAQWVTGVGPGWTGVHDIWPDRPAIT